jgi:hypothetical protein
MHRARFGGPLPDADYAAYDRACLARFQAAFHPQARRHTAFQGILAGLARLAETRQVWLVSGNAPSVLTFKARVLGVDPGIPRLGSLPRLARADLIRKAVAEGPGPHLYVGDRPHDRQAAEQAGVPFLGVGGLVPGDHPILGADAEAAHLVRAVEALLT